MDEDVCPGAAGSGCSVLDPGNAFAGCSCVVAAGSGSCHNVEHGNEDAWLDAAVDRPPEPGCTDEGTFHGSAGWICIGCVFVVVWRCL